MSLLSIFKGRRSVRELSELADFIDENAAFVTQKGIFEYSRMRAGHYAKVLFSEPEFHVAVERSRWLAYPLGLAMLGELADGVLRSDGAPAPREQQDAFRTLVLSVFDRYPKPTSLEFREWRDAHADLDRRMQSIGQEPPRRSFEIADPVIETYFSFMPIHEKLRARDFPTMHNYLRLTLCNVHIELTKRIDVEKVRALLRVNAAA